MADLVRFTETMTGWLAATPDTPYPVAARRGRAEGRACSFVLTVVTPDVDAMIGDPRHRAPAFGCVLAPDLSPAPIAVEAGHLDLFAHASPDGRVLHMRYGLRLRDGAGRAWFLRGCKEVCRRRWFPTFLVDTTHLFVDLWEGPVPEGPPALRGVLVMGPVGFLGQVLSFRGAGAAFGLRGIVRYLGYYVRCVVGVVFGPHTPSPREERGDLGVVLPP